MTPSKGTILVTGSNGGLGSAIVKSITESAELSSNHHGVFVVRDSETATTLKGILSKAPSSFQHKTLSIDLSRLSSVREGAQAINALVAAGSLPPIRALIISAGFQEPTTQTFTQDGFDMTFQVNYLSQFLLVLLLLQSLDKEHGRIVIVSGMNHDTEDVRNDAAGIYKDENYKVLFHDTESLAKGTWCNSSEDPSSLAGQRRYGAAHLLEVMFMRELQNRINADPLLSKIAVVGYDPGAMPTDICRREAFYLRVVVMKVLMPIINPVAVYFSPNGMLRTTTKAASDVLYAAFDTATLGECPKGAYLNGIDPWPTSKEADNENSRDMLWRDSVRYAGVTEGDTVLANWS